jgi:hypothetical protein
LSAESFFTGIPKEKLVPHPHRSRTAPLTRIQASLPFFSNPTIFAPERRSASVFETETERFPIAKVSSEGFAEIPVSTEIFVQEHHPETKRTVTDSIF